MLVTTVARPSGHGEWDEMYAALMPKRSREDFEGATSQDDSPSMENVFAVLTAAGPTIKGVKPKEPEGEET